jgi:hypothetical protein
MKDAQEIRPEIEMPLPRRRRRGVASSCPDYIRKSAANNETAPANTAKSPRNSQKREPVALRDSATWRRFRSHGGGCGLPPPLRREAVVRRVGLW